MKTVLVLGAGLVAKPLVKYLLDQPGIRVIVADRSPELANEMVGDHPKGEVRAFDVKDTGLLKKCIDWADVVVSLLPYTWHVLVACMCLVYEKHLVTASYVSDAMRELGVLAQEKGLIFLNELGLDPGIDHMSAMRVIDAIKAEGGELTSFRSYCGGLPAPDCNDNPWGYKFSWSPRGVVMAARNSATYLKDGEEINVPRDLTFANPETIEVGGTGSFEAYPNRDSLRYIELYGIDSVKTMYRGTLRYAGWCRLWHFLKKMDFLSMIERPDLQGMSFNDLMADRLGVEGPVTRERLAEELGLDAEGGVVECMDWLGLLSDDPLPPWENTVLDVLVARLRERCVYAPGERDMIVMKHFFGAVYPDGRKEERSSTLVAYGEPGGPTAMARTVSLPVAIATRLIAEGKIKARGVQIPVIPEIYDPILDELESLGIRCVESTES